MNEFEPIEENEAIGCLVVIAIVTIITSVMGYFIGLPQ